MFVSFAVSDITAFDGSQPESVGQFLGGNFAPALRDVPFVFAFIKYNRFFVFVSPFYALFPLPGQRYPLPSVCGKIYPSLTDTALPQSGHVVVLVIGPLLTRLYHVFEICQTPISDSAVSNSSSVIETQLTFSPIP